MNFDLRLPIGCLFGFYGVVLVVYGLLTSGSSAYERSLDLNVNLIWGLVLLAFGVLMLLGGLRNKKRPTVPDRECLDGQDESANVRRGGLRVTADVSPTP